ncbi:MAG: D-alanyl-D-alanine carboxypeptidase [Bacillati bacterium ANGP1]|uniref:D-alanyl-D-alanine carboxypeptidase n=1 Tax=Candidatus Segetimicrobium genomatis TaxID=2569760 RepID=A0A537K0F6_9BACT|nr:MAG: D-alanyl-D-alanine carboxypeptidase [Terrabacteria group bacterium ANGP1]
MRRMGTAVRCLCAGVCLALLLVPAGAAPRVGAPLAAVAPPAAERGPAGPPGPPSTLLMEVFTGQVLAESDAHRQLPPASLDKLMTLYLTLQAVKTHRLDLSTTVTVSVDAWRIGRTPRSSRMFLNVGDRVTIEQLLYGLMVASGNDAAETLAEAIAASPEQFVDEMNATAARLGLRDTHFVTPHGLPTPGEHTSAWDMGHLAREILVAFPDAVTYTSPRYMAYGGIRQANWNNLVFRDPRVDGLKTGFTDEAGFNIVSTASQGPLRLIAVVMGAHTLQLRTAAAEALLNMGFARYELVAVPWQRLVPSSIRVYGGRAARLRLETPRAIEVLVTRDDHSPLTVSEELRVRPIAPFQRGQQVAFLTIRNATGVLATSPLLAAAPIDRGGILARLWSLLRYRIGGLLRHRQTTWTATFIPQQ